MFELAHAVKFTREWITRGFWVTAILTAVTTNAAFTHAAPGGGISWKEGQILVKPRAGVPEAKLDEVFRRNGGKAVGRIRGLDVRIVQVPAQAEDAVARALSRDPHIGFAEKDVLTAAAEFTPSDPEFYNAWHLSTLQTASAWELTSASGVTIAILDSGVSSNHPDLAARLLPGWNSVSNNSDTEDLAGHGTKVAGTAAAVTDNGTGISGIAWDAYILPVRVSNLSSGAAYTSDIANGLVWAADNGADVANISYHVSTSSTVSNAAQYMRNKGGVVVVAAGNSGSNTGLSDNQALIAVSATSSTDDKASFSNYGNYIDVAAPGVNILTTTKDLGYGPASGTSFASPAVAGVVALIKGANPMLSPDEVEAILESSADDLVSGMDWHAYYGHGRVNAATAVRMAMETVGNFSDFESPTATIFSPSDNLSVSGIIPVEVSANDNLSVSEVALYADNQLIGIDSVAPFQFSWDSTQLSDGAAALTAFAYDAAGNEGRSNTVTVQVENTPVLDTDTTPPLLDILNPVDGANVSRNVNIHVMASDDYELSTVDLYIDGIRVVSDFTGDFEYSWNTRKAGNGLHLIEAIASDAAGNTSNSLIQITVGSGSTDGSDSKGKKGRGKK